MVGSSLFGAAVGAAAVGVLGERATRSRVVTVDSEDVREVPGPKPAMGPPAYLKKIL